MAQAPEQLRHQACIDRQCGALDAGLERIHGIGDEQGGTGVEQDDVALGARFPAEDRLDRAGILVRRPASQPGGRGHPEAELRSGDGVAFDALGSDVEQHAAVVERQLVDALAVDHERPGGPEPSHDLGHPRRVRGIADTEQLALGSGRVGEGPEQVERGPDPDLASRRAGVLHRRMEVGREHERKAEVRKGRRRRRRVVVDPDAERIEDIGRAGLGGHGPVAVLGHRHPRGRHDEGRCGRYVKRAAAVAAGPDDIDGAGRRRDHHDPFAHRGRESSQLVDGLAAHPQPHEQGRQLRRRGIAIHDRPHREAGILEREGAAIDDGRQRRADAVAHLVASGSGSTPSPAVQRPAVANEPVASSSREASPSPA